MVKATFEIPEKENRILNIVKGQHGFSTKEEACVFIIGEHEQVLEPEIRPEYVKKIKKIEKEGNFIKFSSIDKLKESIENA